jgi:hypothetical protein
LPSKPSANGYFSPKKFNAVELFMEILKDEKLEAKSWFYNANLATGFQFIETVVNNGTYRVQAKFGYKFSDRLTFMEPEVILLHYCRRVYL